MNRRKYFIYPNGNEGMIIDCDDYEVEIHKSVDENYYDNMINFTDKKTKNCVPIITALFIDWDKEEDGGRLTIKYLDRWGCEMIFIHYAPTDIKGMFDFIGKGYGVFENLYKEQNNG